MKYLGYWSVNNNGTYDTGYKSNNKRQLAKDLREIVKGNVFQGNSGFWSIEDSEGHEVAKGYVKG